MDNLYVIGEIGQNHNGSVDIAKLIVDYAARAVDDQLFGRSLKGFDAIKMTKRDLNQELTDSMMNMPYSGAHSFGKTYGEHREFLELTNEEHFEVYKHAKSKNLDVIETLCAPNNVSMFKLFMPDRIKVASRDLTNLLLLEVLAETQIPIIISTGMAGKNELDNALSIITKYHTDISIMHCVSEYPTQYKNVNLLTIKYLQENYSNYTIGYSDHTIGIVTPVAAVAMGAQIIEKHITLDRKMKGTDQSGSLGIDGMERMMRDLRNIEESFGVYEITVPNDVANARKKLERSIASKRKILKGDILSLEDLHLLSPGDGVKWAEKDLLIGRKVINDISKNEIIYDKFLEKK